MQSALVLILLMSVCYSGLSFGQKEGKKITVTGRVTDADNNPVSGAAIFIDKEKSTVTTDKDGNYRIRVSPSASEILVFTLLNGASEQLINGRNAIDFKLTGRSSAIPDSDQNSGNTSGAKVNASANENRKRNNASVIELKNTDVPVYQDIYDMIRGRLPGVEVSGKSIRIRGVNSLNISTEPLFVLDGVIVNSIDDIAPESVKTIEVLKGPDATAYGTRGSNGVILITRRTTVE